MSFPYYQQPDSMDCGPTCLRMVAKYYGKNYSLQVLRERTQIGKEGVNMLRATRAVFINGRALPENYSINELKNIF